MKTYEKNSRLREQRITTINLEKYQSDIIKANRLNLSLLIRDLLKTYLENNYPNNVGQADDKKEVKNGI